MTNFETAVEKLLEEEGGYCDNAHDAGGATNYGISLRFLREILPDRLRKYSIFDSVNEETIKNLTVDQAKLIYKHEFWLEAKIDCLNSSIVATYVLDMCVLHGSAQGIKLLQRAISVVFRKSDYIPDDGIMGHETITTVNQLCANYSDYMELLLSLLATRAEFVRSLISHHLDDKDFLNGWLQRCYRICAA